MASQLALLTGVVKGQVTEFANDIFGPPPSDLDKESEEDVNSTMDPIKAKKEERKRLEAQKQYEEEKKKQRQKAEYQREKLRDNMRQKYGIEKKTNVKKTPAAMIQEVKRDYDMTEEEFAEFKDKIAADEEERRDTTAKIEEKLERRAAKKELKKNVKESCKTQ